ncbi:dihydrolipoamide acetyltransferase family protein [Gaoshiqia sediminis]|uniref:Dihydrolipoamide acetyltransferase component of pyruvate dehydrogenase complex n=1 Tax=Gaoshiqia sediminis TaxID=2986998 RepID=A0AA41Y6R1_9BACT|nr:dihydrolipoamide acetyltransferase family protein [Gaoshiqia sediminis]MCW0482137.1 2-oxo acid dehydrogenase subunit E2 [Gaoshiqia sediminis]
MSEFKIQMPKMGESVQEATITKWFVKEGDKVEEDDVLFEIATEKVDSEIPSPVDGIIKKILFEVDAVVPVGEVVAYIETDEDADEETATEGETKGQEKAETTDKNDSQLLQEESAGDFKGASRFYSPLVRSIAKEENISLEELEKIHGSGTNGRVQKQDLLDYIAGKTSGKAFSAPAKEAPAAPSASVPKEKPAAPKVSVSIGADDQIIEMDRVRKIIAEHMVNSVQVAPHVTSVVEADVTNLVLWRKKMKDEFQQKYNQNLTFMPVFTEAVAMALREFPMVNASVDGDKIILRSKVNVGIAVAKPDGNLIVPVIKEADQKNLIGLTSTLNDLANRARNNKLSPDEISGGTFSITNFGSFRNIIGTPIINQPQVAILATGSIEKKPAVMETPTGDAIVVRHKMFLSLSYDHRIIDGAMGGAFLRRIADILEEFDVNRKI